MSTVNICHTAPRKGVQISQNMWLVIMTKSKYDQEGGFGLVGVANWLLCALIPQVVAPLLSKSCNCATCGRIEIIVTISGELMSWCGTVPTTHKWEGFG